MYFLHPGNLLHPDALILYVLSVGLLVLKLYALVDCLRRPSAAFIAHGKLTKPIWTAILAVSVLLASVVIGIIGLVLTVAAIVYIVDVKPAITGTGSSW